MKKAILASCSGAMTERWFLYMKILRVSSEISMMLLPCNNIESTEPVLFHSVCVGASGGLVPAGSYPAASLTVRFLVQGCSRFVPEPYWIYMNKYEYNNSNIYIHYNMLTIWHYMTMVILMMCACSWVQRRGLTDGASDCSALQESHLMELWNFGEKANARKEALTIFNHL